MTERPKGEAGRKRPRTTNGGGHSNRKLLAEARAATTARRSAARLDATPVDAIQEILDGYVADLRLAQKMVDGLDELELWRITYQRDLDGELVETGRMPNEWIRLRDDYRQELATLATRMVSQGIAEKAVNVRAAQAALMATMVKEALRRAGADPTLIARAGDELRQLAQEATGE
jgi:hypothetical protein